MGRLLLRWALLATSIGLTAAIIPGVHLYGGVFTLLWVTALFAVVNAVLGTVLRVLAAPLIVVTLGLFTFVVNASLLQFTSYLSDSFYIAGFGTAIVAAICITVFSTVLHLVVPSREG
jgi:putative membrane protein